MIHRIRHSRITAFLSAASLATVLALNPSTGSADALGGAIGGAIIGGIIGGGDGAAVGAGIGFIGGAVDAERREHYRARDMDRYYRDRYIDDRRYRGSRRVRRTEIIEYD